MTMSGLALATCTAAAPSVLPSLRRTGCRRGGETCSLYTWISWSDLLQKCVRRAAPAKAQELGGGRIRNSTSPSIYARTYVHGADPSHDVNFLYVRTAHSVQGALSYLRATPVQRRSAHSCNAI